MKCIESVPTRKILLDKICFRCEIIVDNEVEKKSEGVITHS